MTQLYFCVGARAPFNHWLCTTGKPPSALWGKLWRSQPWCATLGLQRPRVHECEKLSSRHSQTRHLNEKRRPQFLRSSNLILRSLIWDSRRPHSRTKISTMQSRSRQGKTTDRWAKPQPISTTHSRPHRRDQRTSHSAHRQERLCKYLSGRRLFIRRYLFSPRRVKALQLFTCRMRSVHTSHLCRVDSGQNFLMQRHVKLFRVASSANLGNVQPRRGSRGHQTYDAIQSRV